MVRRQHNAGQKDCAQMWFGPDFRGSLKVQAMTWAEQGMYRHLLDLAWENGGIPSDLEDVRSILRLSPEEFAAAWKRIGRCFVAHPDDPDRLINERQEKERGIRESIRQERAEAGARGNSARWGVANGSQSDRKPIATDIANGVAKHRPPPPPPPSPSLGVPLCPSGPDVSTQSSYPQRQQDEIRLESGPAGPSGTGGAIYTALRASSYRRNSRSREVEVLQACARLDAAGIGPDDLLTLAKKAARGKKPAGLFAHWIDNPDEAAKELSKR